MNRKYLLIIVFFVVGCASQDTLRGQKNIDSAALLGGAESNLPVKQKKLDPNRPINSGKPIYDCDFDIADYFKNPAVTEYRTQQGWMNWIRTRMAGGLLAGQGKSLYTQFMRAQQNQRLYPDKQLIFFYAVNTADTVNDIYYVVAVQVDSIAFFGLSLTDYERFTGSKVRKTGYFQRAACPLAQLGEEGD